MLKVRREAAEMVVANLHSTEQAISKAIRCAALLAASVEDARSHAGLSMIVGVDAGASVMRAIGALGTAQVDLAQAHSRFTIVQGEIGLGKVMFGDGGAKPPNDSIAPAAQLSVAA